MSKLIYSSEEIPALRLPYSQKHRELINDVGYFELLEDPRITCRCAIIGMAVVRPLTNACRVTPTDEVLDALFDPKLDWVFDVNAPGLAGGGTLSDGSVFDAYRLGLQYACSDAVLVGSATVISEGLGNNGYVWQPWMPCSWPHVASTFGSKNLECAFRETRREWQAAGVLSTRDHPAQIVITGSGEREDAGGDILDARIFNMKHPDESPYECYILTSVLGAARLRARALTKGWSHDKIDNALLICSPSDNPSKINEASIPSLLFAKLGMRIVNHDGGAMSLRQFARADALAQLNLSMGLEKALKDTTRVRSLLLTLPSTSSSSFEEELKEEKEICPTNLFRFLWASKSMPEHLKPRVAAVHLSQRCELLVTIINMKGGTDL